ncbi:type II toxin-antitoxin system VapC family toxin [Natronobacterium gregoryi]|uniref:Nucleic acid-binding protein, contains PIN domain n=2 Tax=Natronobacterium gregoryi TaxID=44930 RepID=L0ANJ6_NATGS|nr:PIN domain-containing protein [Natronobacterium gregoryi]AFZ74782.1 putative nucleic acid-binding protein, contains PIN domain [Natronobacterium gregoryi SP2]ELY73545.1 PilT protein domain protein [Natronobacterium gregoryi SP2]PLK19427.1 PIN domain-containing protein [Natronobacterium gregoryi SP2]SFJ49277.1 Predicted nucleic acid-binding protein, contains PIN domain [Natronobacterium gregoryi]
MIYADTDFFLALIKDDDWLQDRAATVAQENEGEIYTSRATLLELLVISNRFEFDRMEALAYALEIATIPEDEDVLFQAVDYMEQNDLTPFDAYHVAYADEDPIVSSDKSFDEVTDDRLALEERES